MAEYLAPGVYVEEFDSGPKAMEGVSTSTAGFIGQTQRGPVQGKPVLITSPSQYRNVFGGHLNESVQSRYLSYAIDQFFTNGGSSAYVMRVASASDVSASLRLTSEQAELKINAKNIGNWGNTIKFSIRKELQIKTNILRECEDEEKKIYAVKSITGFKEGDLIELINQEQHQYNRIQAIRDGILEMEVPFEIPYKDDAMLPSIYIYRVGFEIKAECENMVEAYHVSLNDAASDDMRQMVSKGLLIEANFMMKHNSLAIMEDWLTSVDITEEWQSFFLQGGKSVYEESTDLYIGNDLGPGKRTGLCAFKEVDDVSIMCIPGVTIPEVQSALVEHCENFSNRFAILDLPKDTQSIDEMLQHRSYFDTTYGACYHPWLQYYDASLKRNEYFPPSATIAGIYARVDNQRGVHKAPANETIRGCTGLQVHYNEAEQGKVNPKGVNLIRALPGQGIRVWGARTMSSDGNWKYVNVRRLFIYIEESIRANTNWAVFEPNDANLWLRVESSVRMFLNTLWRNGALVGASPDEAFFVNIGASTMTQDDILNGRLICVIGAAPVRPAEFVIFRITQKMQDA